ncbi:hypothetical protein Ddye_008128 [Dipteronia dyeriana]|uniref:MULE transposase domain-containing protein n=1 Tax=Dipteronia dyeriana TaxID=168575 RepID=A0AAE0CL32_9ROSI|nr:hypothetical protein Ddye_008128 [Dipteronia dyeriana]
MDIFTITVMFRNEVDDVGQCDSDHISLISLIRATIEELSGQDVVPNEDCLVWIHLPWCDERVEGGCQTLGWCDFEADKLNYDGDSEKDDDKDGEDESVDGDDGIMKECMDLFEGYQSKSKDEYFSDSELEPAQVRIAKLVKGIPFKKMMDGDNKFEVGQTFDNIEQMKELFREYAIQEGFPGRLQGFIGMDGCHLKGPYGGVLLSAVALDANSGLFPLAVCICKKETQSSWEWFLNNLKIHLKYPSDRNLTFMSDRQKRVIHALH